MKTFIKLFFCLWAFAACDKQVDDFSISLSQDKIDASLDWHTFPVNSFSSVELNPEQGKTECCYHISASEIYINPSIRSKIFHGNLIQKKMQGLSGVIEDTHHTYNPITISALVGGHFYTQASVYPSFKKTDALYRAIKSDYPNSNLRFSYQTSPIQYNSYKHLNLLGVGNLGLKLDEIITGKSYTENEMKNRTGLIYNYYALSFVTTMDLPSCLIKETIPASKRKELSYISDIAYGKTAFLILETAYDYTTSTLVVNKIMKDEQLSDEEKKVKRSITANYLTFNANGDLKVTKGIDVIRKFMSEINEQPIIPLSFSIGNYDDNSVGCFELTFKQP